MRRHTSEKAHRGPAKVYRAGRPIDWTGFDTNGLDDKKRARAGASWKGRMGQEFLAVGAFATLTHELAEEGCDPIVLQILTRAASDEVRHADVCRAMAERILDVKIPTRWKGVPSIPKHVNENASTRVLLHMVEMCCLSETFTGVFFTDMLGRMEHGAARSAVESLLEDEIDHGRVGWAYLASRSQSKELDGLAEALPRMLDRTMGTLMRQAEKTPERDDKAMEAVGYLGLSACADIFRRTLKDVILPGFEACDVDVAPVRRLAKERSWL